MGPAALLNIVVNAQTGQATAALTKTQAQLKGTAATAQTSSARIGKAATAAGARLAALGRTGALAGGVVAAASTKMAYDFEKSMMKVQNLVGASEKQVDEWGDALLKMAGKVGKSPQELADALYFVSSSGIETAKVLETVKIAAQASAAGLGEAEVVADALTSAMNAYKKSGLGARDATNVLMKTVKLGKLEADSLAGSIGRVIPVASQLNVPFKDVGASLASMSLQGLDAAEATTALRAIFTSMIKPTDASEKALGKVGLSAEDLRASLEDRGTLATLQMLSDKFKGNVESMGEIFPNVRALVGAFNLTGDNAKRNAEIVEEFGLKTDDLGKSMKNLAKDPTFQMEQGIASIQAVMTKFGQKVLPVAADALKDFADILSDKKLTSDEKITAILDKISGVVDKALPKIAEVGAKLGVTLVKGLGNAFLNSGILGKLFIAATFVRLIGGKGALGKIGVALGKKIGLAMAPVLAAETAAGMSIGGAAAGAWRKAGRAIGVLMAPAMAVAAARIFDDEFEDIHDKWAEITGQDPDDPTDQILELPGPLGDAQDTVSKAKEDARNFLLGKQPGKIDNLDWEKTLDLKGFNRTARDIGSGHGKLWGDLERTTGRGSDDVGKTTKRGLDEQEKRFDNTRGKLDDVTRKQAQDVSGNVGRMVDAVGGALQTLGSNTNRALQSFGAKKVGFSIEKAANTIGSFAGKQKGGSVVPGSGSGDKVFSGAWTEPNEGLFVLNRNAMGAYQHFNDLFPRFPGRQAGGWVDPAGPGTGVVNPAIAGVVGKWSQRYDAAINYGYDPGGGHVSPGHNVTGTATDTGPAAGWLAGATALFERGLRSLVSSGLQVLYGTAGIGTPFPNHGRGNHAHIEWGSNPGAIGMAEQIARMVLEGPDGPLKSMGQGSLDKARRAANAFLLKQMTVTGGGDLGSFGAAGTLGKSQLTSLWSGANSFGNPNLMAAIALAESGGNPAAHGPPDGRGLWQIEWPIWGSTLGHLGNPYSPVANAQMAGEILKQQGLGAWVVYNTGAHQQFLQKGGEIPSFHDGGMFRSKRPGGEGLAVLRDREIVSTEHDIKHLRKRLRDNDKDLREQLRDDDLDNKDRRQIEHLANQDRRRLERRLEIEQLMLDQLQEIKHEMRAMRRQGEQANRLNRQELDRWLGEKAGQAVGQMGSRRALGTAGSGSVGRY